MGGISDSQGWEEGGFIMLISSLHLFIRIIGEIPKEWDWCHLQN